MKLVFAIVHDEDGAKVTDELNANGFSVTKLCSTGGFLKSGNTTLLMGVEEEKVDQIIDIIEKKSKRRKYGVKPSASGNGVTGVLMPNSVEIELAGATVFVTDVERFEKV
jgi:uncharacterized protein YaaQ